MNCMKCGREIEEGQVFCPDCLEEMEKHPVKPGTAVLLPRPRPVSPVKKAYAKWRQPPAPEEMVVRLKKRLRILLLVWLLTLVLLAMFAYPTVRDFLEQETLLPGQNYTTITTTAETD